VESNIDLLVLVLVLMLAMHASRVAQAEFGDADGYARK
jgi:ABC-type cobalt transport system substrate-binding protein